MAGTTTNRAYPYPTSGDAANIAANIQSLATSIDTDVNTLAPKASPTFTGVATVPAIKWGVTTTATAGGTTTLTSASTFQQYFTGTLNQTVVMPVTSTLAVGWSYEINNNSTGTLTVNSSGGNLILSIPGGSSGAFTCIGTTLTTAADWEAEWNGAAVITGTGSVVLSASPTFTGQVTVPAGTTSAAPIIFPSSALLTTAAGGRMEYDNTAFYLTPSQTAVGGRAVINHSMVYALSATRNLADVATAQSVFGVGLTVAAATTYEIDMMFAVSSTGVVSNSLGIGFGGTATLTSIGYEAIVSQGTTAYGATPNQYLIQVATNSTVTSAVASATYRIVRVKGLVRVNASGTFIPQLTYSAASGAVPVVAANSYIKMTPVGTNTVTTIGAWA